MGINLKKKPNLIRNSISNQTKQDARGFTINDWNNTINTLKLQSNLNTEYLEQIHKILFSDYDTNSSGFVEGLLNADPGVVTGMLKYISDGRNIPAGWSPTDILNDLSNSDLSKGWSAAKIYAEFLKVFGHMDTEAKHREIDDSSDDENKLLSSKKINTNLSGKSGVEHDHVLIQNDEPIDQMIGHYWWQEITGRKHMDLFDSAAVMLPLIKPTADFDITTMITDVGYLSHVVFLPGFNQVNDNLDIASVFSGLVTGNAFDVSNVILTDVITQLTGYQQSNTVFDLSAQPSLEMFDYNTDYEQYQIQLDPAKTYDISIRHDIAGATLIATYNGDGTTINAGNAYQNITANTGELLALTNKTFPEGYLAIVCNDAACPSGILQNLLSTLIITEV